MENTNAMPKAGDEVSHKGIKYKITRIAKAPVAGKKMAFAIRAIRGKKSNVIFFNDKNRIVAICGNPFHD